MLMSRDTATPAPRHSLRTLSRARLVACCVAMGLCIALAGPVIAADSQCQSEVVNQLQTQVNANGVTRTLLLTTRREVCVSLPQSALAFSAKDLAAIGLAGGGAIADASLLAGIAIGIGGRIDDGVLAGIGIGGGRIDPGVLKPLIATLAALAPRIDGRALPFIGIGGGRLETSVRYVTEVTSL